MKIKRVNRKKTILAINGSASQNASNLAIIHFLSQLSVDEFEFKIIDDLTVLPHFKTALTENNVPNEIIDFRNDVANADGIIICTPEYVFSIPSGLKNALEWCVSTTVFSDKPIALITASANGVKGHEELKLIMKTLQTIFSDETTLLIQGVKGKVKEENNIADTTKNELMAFFKAFKTQLNLHQKL